MSYRLRRYDAKNIVIEELVPGGLHPITRELGPEHWETYGYYGKLEDTISPLINLLLEIPDADLSGQVRSLSGQLIAVKAEIINIINEVTK